MSHIDTNNNDANHKGILIGELAQLPEKSILDERRLAEILKVSPRTLRRIVARAELPPPISLGGRSVWLSDRLLLYLNYAAERAEHEAARQNERISKYSP